MSLKNPAPIEGINVRDEREFKLWIKFIASVQKEGGDINRPLDILWRSVNSEFKALEKKIEVSEKFITH